MMTNFKAMRRKRSRLAQSLKNRFWVKFSASSSSWHMPVMKYFTLG